VSKVSIINIILIFIVSCIAVNAQSDENYVLDSLQKELFKTAETVNYIDLQNQITREYWEIGLREYNDSLMASINKAIYLSRKINYYHGLASALYDKGKYYIAFFHDYAKSTPFLLESLGLYHELNDKKGISKCHLQLGLTSYVLQYYEDAIRNFKISISYHKNTTSTYLTALSYAELGSIEFAKKYLQQSINEFRDENNEPMLNSSFMYLGNVYNKEGKTDSAEYYLKLVIENYKSQGQTGLLTRPYAFLSQVYLKSNNLNKAIQYAELSYNLTKKSYDIISVMESSYTLSKAYEKKGNFRKAFFFLDLMNRTKEEYFAGSTKQKVAEMQSAFDFKKKWHADSLHNEKEKLETELAYRESLHEKNNERNIIIAIGLGIVILAGGLFNRLRYIRKTSSIIKKEKERSDDLLLNILPREVAEELKTKGTSQAKQFHNVTVMFTDFVNFTKAVEKMTAQELIDELHECFKEFDTIIQKYNIEKIKTSGDSYMAVCGLPLADPKHAENIVRAAIEINDFISERMKNKSENNFEIRIGINSGSVIAGIVGVKKFAYDIWGDTVNTAARMEQNSEPGKINISGSTYELIKDKFKFIHRGKILAKNKGRIDMYFVEE